MGIPIIVCFTENGLAARLLAKYQPKAHIIAVSDSAETTKGLTVVRGVHNIL